MGSVPSRGGPTKRPCPGSPGPRRKRRAAPGGTKRNGPSSPGWCALAATVAASEAEFVRFLRDAGLAARPRYDRVGGHRVVGYAVGEEPSDGGVAVFFGGGKLARDLSLPALRERWRHGEAESQDAARRVGWWSPGDGRARGPSGQPAPHLPLGRGQRALGQDGTSGRAPGDDRALPGRLEKAPEGLGEVVRRLGAVPAEDVATWRAVASDAAGVLAVLSGRLERSPGRSPVPRPSWPARPKGPANSQRRPATSRAAPSSRWLPSWPKRTSTRTHLAPGGFSWPRCSGWPRRSTTPTWRARNPSRLAAWPTRRVWPWRRQGPVSARWERSGQSSPRCSRLQTGRRDRKRRRLRSADAARPPKVDRGQSSSPGRQRGGHQRSGPGTWGGDHGTSGPGTNALCLPLAWLVVAAWQ